MVRKILGTIIRKLLDKELVIAKKVEGNKTTIITSTVRAMVVGLLPELILVVIVTIALVLYGVFR